MGFLEELNRRNVTRVAGAYLAGAWLVVQVTETVVSAYGFGEGAIRTLVTLLAIGFVAALVLAWVFEITPSGVKLERDVERDESFARRGSRRLDRAIMVTLALALALAFFLVDKFVIEPARSRAALQDAYARGQSVAGIAEPGEHSIAVLPFANLSGDANQEYFSDGVSEELLNSLARIPELRVVSRTSAFAFAFAFKEQNPGIPEIARRLQVTHVLEGSVRISGNRVRITAQLIDAQTDSHVWSDPRHRPRAPSSALPARDDRLRERSRPPDALCLSHAAELLDAMGDFGRSIRIREYLGHRDPVNPVSFINLGYSLYLAGRLDDALAALESAKTLNPDMAAMESLRGLAYAMRGGPGDMERALAAVQQEPVDGFRLEVSAILHHLRSDRAASDAALESLIEVHGAGWPYNVACVFAVRGEVDRAFEWLNRAVEYGDSGLTHTRVDPLLKPLHRDARWVPFLEGIGLADSQLAGVELEFEPPI